MSIYLYPFTPLYFYHIILYKRNLSTMPRKTITSAKSKSTKSTSVKKSVSKSIAKIKLATQNNRTRKSLSKIVEDPDVPESMIASKKKTQTTDDDIFTFIRIYRKTISNLKIREEILRSVPSQYKIGPTIIWTEVPEDLAIFTTDESYENYIGFEGEFANPRSKNYLKKILSNMRMTQGTILIKEATDLDAMNIPVHFCAYRVDAAGELSIFDPSWHSADPGIYSTTAFYDSLDAFGIAYKHSEQTRKHHWQSLLMNDVFCQTWSLQWLMSNSRAFPLPANRNDAAKHIAKYIKELSSKILKNIETYMSLFPAYKLEGKDPLMVFRSIVNKHSLEKTIYDLF